MICSTYGTGIWDWAKPFNLKKDVSSAQLMSDFVFLFIRLQALVCSVNINAQSTIFEGAILLSGLDQRKHVGPLKTTLHKNSMLRCFDIQHSDRAPICSVDKMSAFVCLINRSGGILTKFQLEFV